MPGDEAALRGLVPAGFFILRPAKAFYEPIAPRTRLVSLSNCIVDFLPHWWTRRSTPMDDSERVNKAERLESVLTKLEPSIPPGKRTLADTLRERHPLPAGGQLPGWEVLGEDGPADFHSWHCNDLERQLTSPMGLHLNLDGLLPSLEEADAVTAYCNQPDAACEPVDWLPWALVDCSWAR